jgi:hypothetical protein
MHGISCAEQNGYNILHINSIAHSFNFAKFSVMPLWSPKVVAMLQVNDFYNIDGFSKPNENVSSVFKMVL